MGDLEKIRASLSYFLPHTFSPCPTSTTVLLPTTAKGACADFFSHEAFGDKIFVYIGRDILLKPKLIEKLVISMILFKSIQKMICSFNLVAALGEVVE